MRGFYVLKKNVPNNLLVSISQAIKLSLQNYEKRNKLIVSGYNDVWKMNIYTAYGQRVKATKADERRQTDHNGESKKGWK